MHKRIIWLLAVAAVLAPLPLRAPAARAASGDPIYVSLGDSLSVGFQPGRGPTDDGYVDDLWRRAEGSIPGLRLRKFGCPGETSRAMISGVGSPCTYAAGGQLDAAVAYLNDHAGEVAFITIDIGANDVVNRCFDFNTGVLSRRCVVEMRPRLRARVMHIVHALRSATGQGVPILGMSYHNPFLGLWGLVPHGKELARKAARGWRAFNRGLVNAYPDSGAAVANVAGTFRINDFQDTVFVPGRGPLPLNVARTCRWTWFCSPGSFGDPHPNDTGYRKIGRTFFHRLQPLLP